MALMRGRDVPADAVELNELDATSYVWDLVSEWKSISDTWALKYTPAVLGAINSVSGILINRHYRWKLKLGNYGYLASVIPISLMPGLMTALFHRHSISTNLLLMKNTSCPVCYEMKSAVIQCGFGLVYPMVLGPTSALMFANRYSTYRVPDLFDGPKVMMKFLGNITRPLTGTLATMAAIQLVASSVLTYFEMKNNAAIREKISAIEKKLLDEQSQNAS